MTKIDQTRTNLLYNKIADAVLNRTIVNASISLESEDEQTAEGVTSQMHKFD